MSIFVAVDEAVVMNVDVAVVMTVDEAVGNDAVVMAVDEPVVMSIDEAGVVDNGQDVVGSNDREDVVGSNNREDVVGNDLSRSYGKGGHVLHIGDHLVGEVGLHALDAGHVETVDMGTIVVDIGIAVDIFIAVDMGTIAVDIRSIAVDMGTIAFDISIAVDIGIAVSIANMAGHGTASAAESNQDGLHVVFG